MGILRAAWNSLTGKSDVLDEQTALFSDDEGQAVDQICNYFGRKTAKTQLKAAIKEIYGVGIKSEPDPAKKTDSLETYSKKGFTIQVDNDMVEVFAIGFGQKIVNAHATLFTEPGNRFSLVPPTEKTDVKNAQTLLEDNRNRGGYRTALVRADKIAMQCGSAALYANFENGAIVYRYLRPRAVRCFYDQTITENDQTRFTDTTDIEDATYIIIRLSQLDMETWSYLAIFGRSETYPNGRRVLYTAGNTCEVPKEGTAGIIEYELPEVGQCNPMSLWANQNPDLDVPEYPVVPIYSGIPERDCVFPVYTSLYDDCIEFSRAACHTLSKSQDAATGTLAFMDSVESSSKPLPRTTSGPIRLVAGRTAERIPDNSGACESAYTVLRSMMIDVAAGYSVPDYMVVSEDQGVDSSSGIALQVKTRPLKKFREMRIGENQMSILKLFQIEKAQIALHAPKESDAKEADVKLLSQCSQTWDAGELKMPENQNEAAVRITTLMDKGVMDTIAAIREYYGLPSDDDAIALYDKMKKRLNEYKPLNQALQKKPLGLMNKGGFPQ